MEKTKLMIIKIPSRFTARGNNNTNTNNYPDFHGVT